MDRAWELALLCQPRGVVSAAGAAGFVLASTTPLLSAWYAGRGADPWWLYAISNGASLAALLAYPFLVEPFVALSAQRAMVVVGLVDYAALVAVIVRQGLAVSAPAPSAAASPAATLTRGRQALWLVAAMVPAGLLAATTNFLQTDLIAAPFIWIGPLAVYLASFVVAFSERGRRAVPIAQRLAPAAATLMWIPFVHPGDWPAIAIVAVELVTLFILAVAIHGGLALDRPDTSQLTRFYLVLSAGGVLATGFVALLAPIVFNDIYEYPTLIVLGLVVLALLDGRRPGWLPDLGSDARAAAVALAWRIVPYVAVGAALLWLVAGDPAASSIRELLVIGGVAVALALTPRIAAITTLLAIVAATLITATDPTLIRQLSQVRTFYGVIEVVTSGNVNAEYSGTTLHGLQFTDTKRGVPTTYYTRSGPLGSVLGDLRARKAGAAIGVVGLGVGTIATYAEAHDQLTFFEIDPAVIRIAHDPAYFTFLGDAPVAPRIVEGDGRLSLQAMPAASFDLLVLDAFSSDAVPAHLLTREAMEAYMRTLQPGGILAFHLSNNYYDLPIAVAATARSLGLDARLLAYAPDPAAVSQEGAARSVWVVVGKPEDIVRFTFKGWLQIAPGGPVLTDDYPDLSRVLRWGKG
jgi:SAM-dependent methyltransferase